MCVRIKRGRHACSCHRATVRLRWLRRNVQTKRPGTPTAALSSARNHPGRIRGIGESVTPGSFVTKLRNRLDPESIGRTVPLKYVLPKEEKANHLVESQMPLSFSVLVWIGCRILFYAWMFYARCCSPNVAFCTRCPHYKWVLTCHPNSVFIVYWTFTQ